MKNKVGFLVLFGSMTHLYLSKKEKTGLID